MIQKGAPGFVLEALQNWLRPHPHPRIQGIVDKQPSAGRDTSLAHFRELKAKFSHENGSV